MHNQFPERLAVLRTSHFPITTGKFYEVKKMENNTKKKVNVWRIVAIAACAVIVAAIILIIIATSEKSSDIDDLYYSSSAKSTANTMVEYEYDYAVAEEAAYDYAYDGSTTIGTSAAGYGAGENGSASALNSEAKIIYTAYVSMQSTEFDNATKEIENLVNSLGAYFESQNVYNYSGSYRNAYYTIRIPSDKYEIFLNQAGNICTVTTLNKYAEDVSENYYDTESRLESAQTKLKRLNELLENAEDMADIIEIEEAISNAEWDIDYYSGDLKHYDSLINYSTINIDLQEVYKVEVETTPLTFGERISASFEKGVEAFGDFLQNFVIWLANSWTWLLIIIIVIIVIILIIRHSMKKSASKKAAVITDNAPEKTPEKELPEESTNESKTDEG